MPQQGQGYNIPQGLEGYEWEQYRKEQGITSINNDNRAGVYAGFELWKNNKKANERYGDVTDFQSPLYQQYRQFLSSSTPTTGTNALLAPLMAGGGNQAASQVQAGAQRDELGKERTDAINTGTNQFALGMQSQANPLLSLMSNNAQFSGNLAEQQRQFNASQPDFWDTLLSVVPTIASIALAPMTGGTSLMALPGTMGMMKPGGSGQQQQPSYDPFGGK